MKLKSILIILFLFVILPTIAYFGYKKYKCSSKKNLYPNELKNVPCDKIDVIKSTAISRYKSWTRNNKNVNWLKNNRTINGRPWTLDGEAKKKWSNGELGTQIKGAIKELGIN